MTDDRLHTHASAAATVIRGATEGESVKVAGFFTVWCVGPDGTEKWRDEIHNLITTVGKNDFLDKYLGGSGYTQTFRMGLKGVGTAIAADTQASHASWSEVGLANAPTYTGNRKSVTMGGSSGGVSTSPTQAFAITSPGTVAGCFTNNGGSATIDNTTGVLFSAGDFTGGNKVVSSGDTINVVYSLQV
jgi:hypothetical protein